MGKTKFNTRHAFRGGKKKKTKRIIVQKATSAGPNLTDVTNETTLISSASSRKMKLLGIDPETFEESLKEVEDDFEMDNCLFIVQLTCLQNLIQGLCCPRCYSTGLKLTVDKTKCLGFAVKTIVFCENCNDSVAEQYMSERLGNSKSNKVPFEVNLRSTLSFSSIGTGYSVMKDWATLMNFPSCLNYKAYRSSKEKVADGSRQCFDNVRQKSIEAIFNSYKEIGEVADSNGVLNIAVSFDGTWQKRGHSSHNGVGAVIDLLTGLPIDFEVLSNFCAKCLKSPLKDDPNYEQWTKDHESKCSKNFNGSSNAMEQECAKLLWQRSIEKHNLRYTTMLSDGDSKSFSNLVESKVYGSEIEISKEECVNHVAKRMGSALRKLKEECKSRGESISGKGKLTDDKVIKIQNYFGRAIKDNVGDTEAMRKRIFAVLFHMTSTDSTPQHMHCPIGEKSWCFWQRAVAKGEPPGSHKEHETLPREVGTKLVPIFQRLTDKKLLERCKNRTQNPNESLHGLIWRFCPKITFAGARAVQTATALAICQYTMGASCRAILCSIMGIDPGQNLIKGSIKKSVMRLKKAEKAATKEKKSRRKRLKFSKTIKEKRSKQTEGETYKAGTF